ncbi:peptidase [Gardnerella sp. DNF00983]|uniref:peptidase n=1 Tax=Gardnerella sp. DNF00983 TaxID=2749056 RepID=UPI003BAC731C
MANSNSGKHARKVTLDAAVSNAIAKAVDARKVAAFTVGAAGVLAGAAFAFGATPAMAAETGAAPDTKPTAVTADENAGADKKAEAGNSDDKADAKPEDKKPEAKEADNKGQTEDNAQTDQKDEHKNQVKDNTVENKNPEQSVAKAEDNKSDKENQKQENTTAGQDRDSDGAESQDPNRIKPDTTDKANTKIEINENNADTVPNVYGWGSSDNTYSVDGENHTVTFHFAVPKDGKITSIAIFPAKTNGFNNAKSEKGIDFYSKDSGKHQDYSGEYKFTANDDGSADLKMTTLFRDGNLNGGAEKYTASRSIFVYVTNKDNKETIAYKTNVFRAVTLVPPKTSGSVVLKYNQELTPEKVQAAITEAGNVETARSDKKSVNDQLSGKFTENIKVSSADAYDKTTFDAINAKKAGDTNSYVAGAKTLNTYMVTDLGFKSGAIPLTVARYDTRIDKPIVEDPTKVSAEVKEDIKKKLARLNNVSLDQVTINDQGEFTINFAGVDPKDAPKIPLRDLVLKKIEEKDISVPAADKATIVYNPLAYNDAEIARIKKAIYEANKENKDLGLSATDYENQISLEYLKGNLTATGDSNKGISNGQAENIITVKIKTDKAVAEFKSDVKAHKLTRLADIRKDYNVSWKQNKIDGRDSDEGLSWSEDRKTIIYRYDPTAAKEFDTNKILNLLKATPKDPNSGLRDLTGNEKLDHEGVDGKGKKSHVGYVIKDDQPTTELSLGNMSGAYWQYSQKVDNSGVDLGDNLSEAGSYSWDNEAKPVFVAAKKDKVYKARLFVLPYGLTMYRNVYMENGNQPWNTPKAINVIFVPQTNHKTSDLKTSVEEHKTVAVDGNEVPTQSAYYNASDKKKEAYDKALKTAKDLLDTVKDKQEKDLTEEQKAQIDNATINLNKARAELDGADTNKDKLNASIEANGKAAEGANPASGTVSTNQFKNVSDPDFKTPDGKPDTTKNEKAKAAKKAYDEALEKAKTVTADDNATQKAVDEAKAKLDAAREKLNEFTTNKDELNNAIAQHGKVYTGDADKQDEAKLKTADPTYQNSTPEQRKAYDDAVKKAGEVVADPNASQKEVNEAIKKLKEAKDALDKNATNKAPLDAAVQKTLDNPDPKDPNKHSVFYTNAAAKKDTDAAAKKAVEDYDKALAEAKRVLGDKNATKADVDKAKKDLEDAEKVLYAETYQTKATDLAQALVDNFSGYLMPAYFNAFDEAQAKGKDSQAAKDFKDYNDAYHAAKDLMDELKKPGSTVDQKKVDAAKDKLVEARKAIDKYATDTSKISAALLHSLAITKSPAYLNASAGAAGSEEAKAKQAYDDALKALQDAFNDKMPQDTVDGKPGSAAISTNNIPAKDGDTSSPDYLKNIQSHAKGQPLNRDVTKLLAKLKEAVAGLDKFATKTDDLLKSVNEDAATHQNPAFKNASQPDFKQADGTTADDTKNNAAKAAVDAYGDALNAAKDLLKNPDATQKQVNDALNTLNEKRKALDAYKTDVKALKDSVGKHGNTQDPESTAAKEGTVTSDAYRNASDPHFMKEEGGKLVPDTNKNDQAAAAKKAYDEALTKAQELLKKHADEATPQDAKPTQKDINKALKDLDEARTKLDAYKTDTTALNGEAEKSQSDAEGSVATGKFEDTPEFKNAKAKTSDGNENADITAYKTALANARKLVSDAKDTSKKNSERPTQKQINDALDALKAAKKQITDNYKTNLEPLTSAKDFAGGDFKKTPEYLNAVAKKTAGDQGATAALGTDGGDTGFDNVLKKVTDKLNDKAWKQKATQKDVNALLKQLKDAQDKIAKEYKTDAIKLEREVGDKDQDGKPVVPPFEASVTYKNALEKAKTEENTTDPNSATAKLKTYADKLKTAQELVNKVKNPDPNAKPEDRPTQAQIDKALYELKAAKAAITNGFKTDVTDLQKEVDDKDNTGTTKVPDIENTTEFKNLKAKVDGDKKPDDLVAYEQALAKAKELIDKNDGKVTKDGQEVDVPKDQLPTQQEVDEAKKALKKIKDKIIANYKTNSTVLQMEVDKSKDGDDDPRDDVFENTPAFKNADAVKGEDGKDNTDMAAYKAALDAAKKLLAKFDPATGLPKTDLPAGEKAPTQKDLDDALDALQKAKSKIEKDYVTKKDNLKSEADANGDFTKTPEYQNAQANGDDESKKALEDYKKALEDANKVLGDKDATQAQVDEALKKLQAAKKKLTDSNKTDKSKLQDEADGDAKFRKSLYFIIGKRDDIEAYKKALAEADSVLNDPNATQAQVDEALRKLQAAKYKLNHPFGAGSGVGSGSGYDTDADAGDGFDTSDSQSALVDKSALQVEVNNSEADSSAASKSNTAAAKAYVSALAEAKRVLADKNATQAQVDEALRKLQAAKAAWRNASGASGNASALAKTGAATGLFASLAAVFSGLGAAGVASRRRKHSNE